MQAEEMTAQWRVEEQASRPGRGALLQPPIEDALDFVPIRMAPGEAAFQGRPQRSHYTPLGTVHGGWFAALLDAAVGCAIHTTLPTGKGFTMLKLKLNLMRPLNDRVPLVRAEGKVIHAGCQVVTAEGRVVGPDGKLYAQATTTCLIFDVPARTERSSHEQT